MCWEPHICWCILPGWLPSVWEVFGVQVNWYCWYSNWVSLFLSFFQLFPNSTTGVSSFYPLVGCKYLHLIPSAGCWVFCNVVMLVAFLWALHSLSQILGPPHNLDLTLGLSLDPLFLRLLSISIPAFLSVMNNYRSEFWPWVGNSLPHLMPCLSAGGGFYKFPLPTVRHFIKGPSLWVLGVSHLPGLWCLLREGVPPTSFFLGLPVYILSAGPEGFSPFLLLNTRSGFPLPPLISPPHVHFPYQVPSSLPTWDCFLLFPKWDWGILT
jgi:hypothetical protein